MGDVEPFVNVVYFRQYSWYAQQFAGHDPYCPGDMNGDGLLTIIGDVPGFVACVYNGQCGPSGSAPFGPADVDQTTYLIGGAIYSDLSAPLSSGLAGVQVNVVCGSNVYTAVTAGRQGLWSLEVPEGTCQVIPNLAGRCFREVVDGALGGSNNATITVDAAHRTENQSIQFLSSPHTSADFDGDCDVDADDYAHLRDCISGPSISQLPQGCENADFDKDNDVDQSDFGVFQRCWSGPSVVADPACNS